MNRNSEALCRGRGQGVRWCKVGPARQDHAGTIPIAANHGTMN